MKLRRIRGHHVRIDTLNRESIIVDAGAHRGEFSVILHQITGCRYHYLKRLCDIGLSAGLLVICSSLIVILAGLIWLRSGRPIFYSQTRVGRGGKQFTLYKLRTMTSREGEESEDIYTRKDDPRIIPVGKILRKLRLDDLPQLWHVFRGDMSLIGPRAEWIKCAERYEKQIPFYHFRHLVKPGITGWAQVNYPYGESDQDAIEKLKFDLYYIRRYSLKLDAMIALKTIHRLNVKGCWLMGGADARGFAVRSRTATEGHRLFVNCYWLLVLTAMLHSD